MGKQIEVGAILLGKYRIEATLGQGGFGLVYKATDILLSRTVAIKTLSQSQTTLEDRLGEGTFDSYLARFRREATVSAFFTQNRNIITVYGLEQDDENFYLVLEYLEGGSLADLLKNSPLLPIKQACQIVLDICNALTEIHQHPMDIVHRDLKPGNILLRKNGQAVVADFGIAQVGQESERTTYANQRHPGSPAYKSPEQAGGYNYLTPASDLYSLGLILYQMVTGRLYAKVRKFPTNQFNGQIPNWLDEVLFKLLQEKPEERYQEAEEIAKIIQAGLNEPGMYLGAAPPLNMEQPTRPNPPRVATRPHLDAAPTLALPTQVGSGLIERAGGKPKIIQAKRQRPPLLVFGLIGLVVVLLGGVLYLLLSSSTPTPVNPTTYTGVFLATATVVTTGVATTYGITPSPNLRGTQTALASSANLLAANSATATVNAAEIMVVRATLTALVTRPTPAPLGSDNVALETILKNLPATNSSLVILPDGTNIGNQAELQLPSASVIKLWIAATAYEESKPGGKLNLNETYTVSQADIASGTGILSGNVGNTYTYDQLISTMLIYSDNSAANIIIKKLGGFDRINQYIQTNGYKQTKLQRFLGDVSNPNNNFTSAQDSGLYMQRLIKGQVVDQESSARISAILQSRRSNPKDAPLNFFGRKLPAGVNYLHLSGTGTRVRNEVGFFDLKKDSSVIVAIFISDAGDEAGAEEAIANALLQISQAVKGY
ncbi:MAG: serine hydrolase [Chloroflexota bacterium]|nr:serine hydrolase [Chloroflexota bacterium]